MAAPRPRVPPVTIATRPATLTEVLQHESSNEVSLWGLRDPLIQLYYSANGEPRAARA